MNVLLEMRGIRKEFPGVVALKNVSLKVERGTVHALMGENGAGKSTLMKCLFGVYSKDQGSILIEGKEVEFKSAADALRNGMAMVHQELSQALKLTVSENIWLGRFPMVAKALPFINTAEMRRRTLALFSQLDIKIDPDVKMERLSVSERQMVEIAKAVSYDAKIIVFDEPTSSLTTEEAEKLFKIINDLKAKGCGIIYISHKMQEILEISDAVSVMRDGEFITTEPAAEMSTEKIITLMVGRELNEVYPKRESKIGEVILSCEELTLKYKRLLGASLKLRAGEILGIAGLDGSGRTELLCAIFGIYKRDGGRIFLDGKEIFNRTPREAIKNGFALITEERRASGIFGILDIVENTTVSSLDRYKRYKIISEGKRRDATDGYISKMRIKTASRTTRISALSGGNQQKVILSRWLLTEPRILLLDEPTRGIDVGAKYEIYAILNDLVAQGKSIIVVSSEMAELLGICDRILVMSGGKVAGEVNAKTTTQNEIMTLASKYV
ncbi:MAG: sugar ABC transporter ATP-binding protein [Clostridia bacterium]|nr:sugar ABC transporter ATP-binding protein [Clostridia bacterium]